jgi:hypothetical protein
MPLPPLLLPHGYVQRIGINTREQARAIGERGGRSADILSRGAVLFIKSGIIGVEVKHHPVSPGCNPSGLIVFNFPALIKTESIFGHFDREAES